MSAPGEVRASALALLPESNAPVHLDPKTRTTHIHKVSPPPSFRPTGLQDLLTQAGYNMLQAWLGSPNA